MANVFSRTNEVNNHPKRNTYDLSFQNNFTGKFGVLYPVICKEILPGDSYNIKPTFALEFMPLTFPVQTRCRANLHFFYVRNRNLWKDFPDFYGRTKDNLVMPYLDIDNETKYNEMCQTGSLGDYMGLPTTGVGTYGSPLYLVNGDSPSIPWVTGIKSYWGDDGWFAISWSDFTTPNNLAKSLVGLGNVDDNVLYSDTNLLQIYAVQGMTENPTPSNLHLLFTPIAYFGSDMALLDVIPAGYKWFIPIGASDGSLSREAWLKSLESLIFGIRVRRRDVGYNSFISLSYFGERNEGMFDEYSGLHVSVEFVDGTEYGKVSIAVLTFLDDFNLKKYSDLGYGVSFGLFSYGPSFCGSSVALHDITNTTFYFDYKTKTSSKFSCLFGTQSFNNLLPNNSCIYDPDSFVGSPTYTVGFQTSPWYGSTRENSEELIKLNALPFRAYESIYNAFYRDERNNPYILNGVAEYNKWCPSVEGGADRNIYRLRYRNWEQDFLTTAVQSPQQGIAPLVGITTYNGEQSLGFVDPENGEQYAARVAVNEDGEVTDFAVETADSGVKTFRSLIDLAQSGIAINDLRNVNALQRWLETNMRKGYRLRDIIKGHFDVTVRFDELDMPEFLGGVSRDIVTTMVTQTSQDSVDGQNPLGSYAGQMSCIGTSKKSIRKYFDEPGYLIGILSLSPVPNYSQLLPKHFLKSDVLDYYFPEFGHIGYQPIRYDEVCPIQTYLSQQKFGDVFGYQRSWYDYIQSVDEVHGLMRTSLRDFLINRVFDKRPELSEQFLLIDPKQTNNIFTVTTENDDVFVGQVWFDIKAKRPIPLYGIPRLE